MQVCKRGKNRIQVWNDKARGRKECRLFSIDMTAGVEFPIRAGSDGTLAEKLSAEMRGIVESGFVGDLLDRHHGVLQQTACMGDAFFPDGVADGAVTVFRVDSAEIIGMALELFRNERGGDFLFKMQQDEPVGLFDQALGSAFGGLFRAGGLRFADQERGQIVAGFRILLRFLLQKKQIAEGDERFGIPDRKLLRRGAESVPCLFICRSEVHPEEGEIRGICGKSAVPAFRKEQQPFALFQMKLPILFEHVERSGKHIDQFMRMDRARGMSAVSAGDETSCVVEKKDRILFQVRNSPFFPMYTMLERFAKQERGKSAEWGRQFQRFMVSVSGVRRDASR